MSRLVGWKHFCSDCHKERQTCAFVRALETINIMSAASATTTALEPEHTSTPNRAQSSLLLFTWRELYVWPSQFGTIWLKRVRGHLLQIIVHQQTLK